MKKILSVLAVFISCLMYTCTEESNPINNTPVIDPITNTWSSESNSDYQIFFQTFDSTVTRGVFHGTEFLPDGTETDLCGFFDGMYVEFDVRRPPGERTKFKGDFINSNRLELQSVEGSLVLTR